MDYSNNVSPTQQDPDFIRRQCPCGREYTAYVIKNLSTIGAYRLNRTQMEIFFRLNIYFWW